MSPETDTIHKTLSLFQIVNIASVWVGVLGFPLSIWGLWWTWQAKTAAKNAEMASSQAVETMRRMEQGNNFSTLTSKMGDLKNSIGGGDSNRTGVIASEIRQGLVRIKEGEYFSNLMTSFPLDDLIQYFGSVEYNFGQTGKKPDFDLNLFNEKENIMIAIEEKIKMEVNNARIK